MSRRLVIAIVVLVPFAAGVATGLHLAANPQMVAGTSVAAAQETQTPTEAARVATSNGLPGGKAYYVVSVGSESQVRVAYLTFVADGSVSWSGWWWDKNMHGEDDNKDDDNLPGNSRPVGSGTWVGECCGQTGVRRYSLYGEKFNNGHDYQEAAGVDPKTRKSVGELRCPFSFNGPPTETKKGRFAPQGKDMRIDWNDGNWEIWEITAADNGIQRLDLRDSSKGLNYKKGIAAGSNSDFSVTVHPDNTLSNPIHKEYSSSAKPASWVLNRTSYFNELESNCSCAPKRTYKNYWIWRIKDDRRYGHHFWCHYLSEGGGAQSGTIKGIWYAGGTHQSAMLQAIDDYGRFRGYISVVAEPGDIGVEDKLRFELPK